MAQRYGYDCEAVQPKPTTDPLVAWAYQTLYHAYSIRPVDPFGGKADADGQIVLAVLAVKKILEGIGIFSDLPPLMNGFARIPAEKQDEFRRSVFRFCAVQLDDELRQFDFDIVVTKHELVLNLCNGNLITYSDNRWRSGSLISRKDIADLLGQSVEYVMLLEKMAKEVHGAIIEPGMLPATIEERRTWRGRGNSEQ